MAEHESTKGYRDLMLTGADVVDLAADYFTNRLWKGSVPVITRGVEEAGWRQVAEELLDRLDAAA